MVPGPGSVSRLDLACEPSSIRSARSHAQDTLERWGIPEETGYDALTIVSELATNAVRHTSPPADPVAPGAGQPQGRSYSLALWTDGWHLYVAVWDENPAPPVLRTASEYAETGRGLHLVAALTDGSWGYERTPEQPGKRVWAALRLPAAADTTTQTPASALLVHPQRHRDQRRTSYQGD